MRMTLDALRERARDALAQSGVSIGVLDFTPVAGPVDAEGNGKAVQAVFTAIDLPALLDVVEKAKVVADRDWNSQDDAPEMFDLRVALERWESR